MDRCLSKHSITATLRMLRRVDDDAHPRDVHRVSRLRTLEDVRARQWIAVSCLLMVPITRNDGAKGTEFVLLEGVNFGRGGHFVDGQRFKSGVLRC